MSRREKLAKEYTAKILGMEDRMDSVTTVTMSAQGFLAGWDARSKDVGELVNMLEDFIKYDASSGMINEARKILTKFKESK